ncbi:hypothetical protein D3C84_1139520 [compost metagenome]
MLVASKLPNTLTPIVKPNDWNKVTDVSAMPLFSLATDSCTIRLLLNNTPKPSPRITK